MERCQEFSSLSYINYDRDYTSFIISEAPYTQV